MKELESIPSSELYPEETELISATLAAPQLVYLVLLLHSYPTADFYRDSSYGVGASRLRFCKQILLTQPWISSSRATSPVKTYPYSKYPTTSHTSTLSILANWALRRRGHSIHPLSLSFGSLKVTIPVFLAILPETPPAIVYVDIMGQLGLLHFLILSSIPSLAFATCCFVPWSSCKHHVGCTVLWNVP